ncbi:MAG: hypothetical protein E7675_06840 [Ruminococcaceae bacterium]|nr:hypothetical protein [Oscillospiraceae bacterium]
MDIELMPDERLDVVNDGVRLIQRKNGLTFGTDALLLAGYIQGTPNKVFAELGGGTGIISLLLLSRKKAKKIYVYEIQEQFADLIKRNTAINAMEDGIEVICRDVRQASAKDTNGEVDLVFSNPPYMRQDSGRKNQYDEKTVARHEVFGTICDFCKAASRLLRYGGDFVAVYPPDRMAELFDAMKKNGIEPKRLTMIFPNLRHRPCLILCSGKKGGKEGMIVTPPLFIKTGEEDSAEYQYIMEHGEFNELYKKV